MADESIVGKSTSAPVGFLDAKTGRLRSKEELAKLDSQAGNAPNKSSQPAVTTNFATQVEDAFSKLQSDFRSNINSVASVANAELDLARAARRQTRSEIKTAIELRDAFKNNADDSVIQNKQRQLNEIISQGQDLENITTQRQRDLSEPRVKALNVGNRQLGVVRVPALKFEAAKVDAQELDSPKELNQFIRERRGARTEVRNQITEFKTIRNNLRDTISGVREELSTLAEDIIGNIGEAQATADNLAGQIRSAGLALVEGTVSNKLDKNTVQQLVSG